MCRSGGNPFFLTELSRGSGGTPLTSEEIPERVHALLRKRLTGLSEASRNALAVIALAGERATAPLLATILGAAEADRSLLDLRAHSLLAGTPTAPRPMHPMLREVVVADLPAARASAVHDQLARALDLISEQTGRRDLAEAAAGHALAAYTAYPTVDRAAGAAAAGLASGGRALRSFAPKAAASILQEALAAFADSAADARAALLPSAVQGWLDLGKCRLLLDDPEAAEAALRAGLDLAEHPLDRARCYRRLAALHYRTGRMVETAGLLEVALAETTDELARAVLETELGWTLHRRDRAAEALPILQRATQVFEDGGSWDLAAWSLDYLGMVHVALGDAERGLALLDRALARDGVGADHFRRGILLVHRAGVLRSLARMDEALGDLTGAVHSLTEELDLLHGTRNDRHLAVAHAHLARLHDGQGRAEEASRAALAARAAAQRAADADVAQAVTALLASGNTTGTPDS